MGNAVVQYGYEFQNLRSESDGRLFIYPASEAYLLALMQAMTRIGDSKHAIAVSGVEGKKEIIKGLADLCGTKLWLFKGSDISDITALTHFVSGLSSDLHCSWGLIEGSFTPHMYMNVFYQTMQDVFRSQELSRRLEVEQQAATVSTFDGYFPALFLIEKSAIADQHRTTSTRISTFRHQEHFDIRNVELPKVQLQGVE